jgi:FtsP/CotA-like multicopper oxidase with cupredoxin domain
VRQIDSSCRGGPWPALIFFFFHHRGRADFHALRSASGVPDIVVKQGDVEDWMIENRSTELHAFHIHQIHFMMLEWSGVPVNEPFLRDTSSPIQA